MFKEMLFNCKNVAKASGSALFVLLAVNFINFAHADDGQMSVTIAPPLFQVNLQPGETWNSGITVVNNNDYDITLYAEPVLFEPSGESGRPVFVNPPLSNDGASGPDESTLAGWITVPQTGFNISREQTYTLPIVIKVPEDAAPGGHYAAILIGNRAPEGGNGESVVNVTSSIASLIFLSVAGDVEENGKIRDFFTEQSVYENAEARLSFRFENQGNVHLLPQGNIVIYNMFGKQRGIIPVNHNQHYGSVLPGSIRKYDFTWESDAGIWDIGRYKAEATISYGKEKKQNALATTYFYVLPIVPFLEILGVLIGSILFLGWAIRAYIHKALMIEAAHLQYQDTNNAQGSTASTTATPSVTEQPRLGIASLVKPIQVGLVDLRNTTRVRSVAEKSDALEVESEFKSRLEYEKERKTKYNLGILGFVLEYKFFFLFVAVVAGGVFALNVFFDDVMTVHREYSVKEIRPDGTAIDIKDGGTKSID